MNPRLRTWIAFGTLFAGIGGLFGIWEFARSRPTVDGIPAPFRRVLDQNGKIWSALFRDGSTAAARRSPPAGKAPRVNGLIGLRDAVDAETWEMEIDPNDGDPGAEAFTVSLAELRALPRVDTTTEFRCIEGWSDQIEYAGVRFSDFLKYYHLGAHGTKDWTADHPPNDLFPYVGLETPDGKYYVSIDMESMLHPQTVLAYEMNGKPLAPENGAPLRLIIPVKYGIKNLKRIGRIFFSDTRPPDYWQERGYDWFAGL